MSSRRDHDSALRDRAFRRILVIKPSSLGDVIHALPVLEGLRTRYPEARIDWLIASAFRSILEGHRHIDELVEFDRKRFARVGRDIASSRDFLRFLRELRARRYDLVLDLQGLFRSGFLAWCTGARVRVGPADAREGAGVFYTRRIMPGDQDRHAVERNAAVGRTLGFDVGAIRFEIPIGDDEKNAVTSRLRSSSSSESGPIIAVVPGARWETKVWPPDRFVSLLNAVRDEFGASCALLGAREDAALCDRIARDCRCAPVNLAGRTTVREFAAAVAVSDLVVCHDSAAAHLAVAFDRPLVCLTGPTDPVRTGPFGRLDDVVRVPLPCSPCLLRRLSQCPHDHQCMKELTVALVLNEVRLRISRLEKKSISSQPIT